MTTLTVGNLNYKTLLSVNKVIETAGDLKFHLYPVTSMTLNVGKVNCLMFHALSMTLNAGIESYLIQSVVSMMSIVGKIIKFIIFLPQEKMPNCLFNSFKTPLMIKLKE